MYGAEAVWSRSPPKLVGSETSEAGASQKSGGSATLTKRFIHFLSVPFVADPRHFHSDPGNIFHFDSNPNLTQRSFKSTPCTNSNSYLNMFQPLTEGCNIWAGSTLIFNFQSSNPDRGFFGSESAILAFTVLYYCLFGYICNVHKVKELQPYSEPKFWYSTKSVWVRICFAVSRSD